MEQRQNYVNNSIDFGDIRLLKQQVELVGVTEDITTVLGEQMKMGKPNFSVQTFQKNESDTLAIGLNFERNGEGSYQLKSYHLTLYDAIEMPGIPNLENAIRELDTRMQQMNWYFELAESEFEWVNGYKELTRLEDALRTLSHYPDPNAERVAVGLWNKHAPPVAVNKPEFIRRIEMKLGIYPEKIFPGVADLNEAYQQLKNYRQIEDQLSHYPIRDFNDPKKRSSVIDGILNRELELVTMEKSVVPAKLIENYVLVEHEYPSGMVYEQGHRVREINTFSNYDDAIKSLRETTTRLATEKPPHPVWDVNLIGRYQDKKLEYDYDCSPQPSTGYVVATGYRISSNSNPVEVDFFVSKQTNETIKVQEAFYVGLNGLDTKVHFFDIDQSFKAIDEEFWCLKDAAKNKGHEISEDRAPLLSKRHEPNEGKKFDSHTLLTKYRVASDKGVGI